MRDRFYCNKCRNITWHQRDVVRRQAYEEEGLERVTDNEIWHCCGCDTTIFRKLMHPIEGAEELVDEFPDAMKIEEQIFPEPLHQKRGRAFLINLPERMDALYSQVIAAYDCKAYQLATIGLRSLVEAAIVDRIPADKYQYSLASKIDSLRGYFSEDVISVLHDIREIGNRATHHQDEPHHLDLHRALNVVESMLSTFYQADWLAFIYNDMKREKERS